MINISANHPIWDDPWLGNSVKESGLLHARNLCDFCTSPHPNNIKPSDLFFSDYATGPQYRKLRRLIGRLDKKYGKGGQGSVRWAFNKKLAHPTKGRGASFNYSRYLIRVLPVLEEVIAELESLRHHGFESFSQ